MHGLSILTVNWNAYDFARVLIESAEMFTTCDYEIVVIDNSIQKQELPYKNVRVYPQETNIGHGEGLNVAAELANFPIVMFLDIDCHFLKRGWNDHFCEAMEGYEVLAGRGVEVKPIRPACMMLKQEIAARYDWRPTPGYRGHRITPEGFDVAIQAYHEMLRDGVKIRFLEPKRPNRYKTLNGEDWCINDVPLVYHHWHGSHLKERQVDFTEDLIEDKSVLFSRIPWRIP